MTDVHPSTCVDSETMAAFVDGRLDTDARTRVEAHLADCVDCYERFADGVAMVLPAHRTEVISASTATRSQQAEHRISRAWTGVAAAAAIVLVAGGLLWRYERTQRNDEPQVTELVAAIGSTRPIEGRLSGGFEWGPLPPTTRSARPAAISPDLQIALAHLEQALDRHRTPDTLSAYAAGELSVGQSDVAIRALEEASALSPKSAPIWSDLSAAYLARNTRDGRAEDLPQALDAAAKAVGLDTRLAEARFNEALALERLSQRSQAEGAWEAYLAIDSSSGWATEARQHLARLRSTASGGLGPKDGTADRLFDRDLPRWAIARRSDPARAEQILSDASRVAASITSGSEDRYPTDVVQTIVDDSGQPILLDELVQGHKAYGAARASYGQFNFAAALSEFARARRALAEAGSPLALSAALFEAIIEYRQNDLTRATSDLVSLSHRISAAPYPSLVGHTEWMLGLIAEVESRHETAMRHYEKALREFQAADESANVAFMGALIADGYSRVGDAERAWQARVGALAGTTRSSALLDAASAATDRSWFYAADVFLEDAVSEAEADKSPAEVADALRQLATTRCDAGEPARARDALGNARQIAARHPEAGWDKLRAELDRTEAACVDPTDQTSAIGAATRALTYYSRTAATAVLLPNLYVARARLYGSAGRPKPARADLSTALSLLERERTTVRTGMLRVSFDDQVRRVGDELAQLDLAEHHERAAFAVEERSRSAVLRDQTAATPITLETLQTALPEDVVVAYFQVASDAVLLWCIRHDAFTFSSTPIAADELARLVSIFRSTEFSEAVGHRLADVVLLPLLPHVHEGDVLLIVPDGPLGLLPFAALPGARSRFLVMEHASLVAPSATVALEASRRACQFHSLPVQVAAIGNPTIDRDAFPNLSVLAGADSEAREVATLYPTHSVITGPDATRAAVTRLLGAAEVVHFAGHAVIDAQDPAQSGLIIADHAPLTTGDIEALHCPRTRVVVLAACEAATGPSSRSEGPMGLARSFLVAGVPTVIASYTLVDDHASVALFTTFHRELRRTGTAVQALREAQLVMLASPEPQQRSPAAWAGFVVIGGDPSIAIAATTGGR